METKLPLKIKHRHRGLNKTIIIKCLPCLEISGKAFCEILEKGQGGGERDLGEERRKEKLHHPCFHFCIALPKGLIYVF